MQNVNSDQVWQGWRLTRRCHHGMRKSCDPCRRKKRRCGQGQPCSRCVQSHEECTYSKRRWRHLDQPLHRQQSYPRLGDRKHLDHSITGLVVENRVLPLKRCSFTASPSTGLVGMRENAFISDFFGCVGFLPLVNESQIREAMVKIMLPVAPQQEAVSSTDGCGEEGHFGTLLGWGGFSNALGTKRVPQDPSLAAFWAAVAVGALAKGAPIEAVESYARLAWETLAACRSGFTNAELARASAMMTYLYSFMGETAKFREYGELSETYLRASVEEESPDVHPGLPYLIHRCRKVGSQLTGTLDSPWVHEKTPVQSGELATEHQLYRRLAESFRAFDDAVYAQARQTCAGDLENFYFCGPSHRESCQDDPLPGEVSDAITKVFHTANPLGFEPLEEVANRPSIRAGIGDLLINGALVLKKAGEGDLRGTLEKLNRSIEVYERYPGLCRSVVGSHFTHMLLIIATAISDSKARGMYDRLRAAINSCRPLHSVPILAYDEWQGVVEICSDLHCRVTETLMKSDCMKALTTLPVNSTDESAGLVQTAGNALRQTQREALSNSVADGEVADVVRTCSGSSGKGSTVTSKWAGKRASAGAVCSADAGLALIGSQSDPSSPLHTGSHDVSNVNAVATNALDHFPISAGVGVHHVDNAKEEDGDVATADWLEVAYAMSDEVHAG